MNEKLSLEELVMDDKFMKIGQLIETAKKKAVSSQNTANIISMKSEQDEIDVIIRREFRTL